MPALSFSARACRLPTPTVLACLEILQAEPEIVDRLWDNANYMRAGLKTLGYNIGRSNTPIIPLIIGDDMRTGLAWRALINGGVYTNPVVPPGVPTGSSLLRTSYTATHQKHHLDRALEVLEEVGHNLDLIPGGNSLLKAPIVETTANVG